MSFFSVMDNKIFIYIILFFLFLIPIITAFTKIIKHIQNYISPSLCVSAKVVSKRQKNFVFRYDESIYKINYYITFNIENNDHLELKANNIQYNSVFFGDTGKLTFKGKKLLSFELK